MAPTRLGGDAFFRPRRFISSRRMRKDVRLGRVLPCASLSFSSGTNSDPVALSSLLGKRACVKGWPSGNKRATGGGETKSSHVLGYVSPVVPLTSLAVTTELGSVKVLT